jgi:predicted ATP-dependent serine protease
MWLTLADVAAIVCVMCSGSTARLFGRCVYGSTWSTIPHWLVSAELHNSARITVSNYAV